MGLWEVVPINNSLCIHSSLKLLVEASCAADLQRAAAAMIQESGGRASALTHKLAAAGSRGRYPNNIPRDISRALQLPLAPPWNCSSAFGIM